MTQKRPKLLVFDVNETLLDLDAMKEGVAEALRGRADLLPLWFTTMLQYSLVSTVGDRYDDFGLIGTAAMMMVGRNDGIELSEDVARRAVMRIRSLPPHPEVPAALAELKKAGFRMVTLTNGGPRLGYCGRSGRGCAPHFFPARELSSTRWLPPRKSSRCASQRDSRAG
jgi:2-haloalkanoic acid dehalogenase type II